MNFEGFQPYPIDRFSSLCEQDDPTNLPLGISPAARNVKFTLTRVRTRDGIQNQYGFALTDGGPVTGLAALKVGGPTGDLQVPIAFSGLGNLYKEFPVGSGNVVPISDPNGIVSLPAGASMQVAAGFANGYLAFGDLKNSLGLSAVYNPALNKLDPLSMLPFGQPWQANRKYFLGECVTPAAPVGGNGRVYQCTQAGISGANQPNFPSVKAGPSLTQSGANGANPLGTTAWTNPGDVNQTDGVSVASVVIAGTIGTPASFASEFLEATNCGFAIPGGATIRGIVITINAAENGDATALLFSYLGASLSANNSGSPAPFFPAGPVANRWIQLNDQGLASITLGGPNDTWGAALTPAIVNNAAFGVYFSAVGGDATAAHPLTVSLQNVTIQVFYTLSQTINDNTVVWTDETPTMLPSATAGTIPFGVRYMVVLFVNRNGYISGMTQASVVSVNLTDSLHQIVVTFPTGPPNTVARILAFTPAGQLGQLQGTGVSSAGPYFWIPPAFPNGLFNLSAIAGGVTVADVVSGVTMNSTLINDNVTTTATFNFTDDYLKATEEEVSDFFRKIQVPGCSDIYFSEVQQRVFYAADILPSGWYVSLANDPESVYGDTGLVQAAENNGQNRTAIRDFNGITYLMKEKSGFALAPNTGDPSTWDANPQWKGSGPCGPRAVDVSTKFMCYVHRSGVWIFEGGLPYRISKELPITWSQINWQAQQTIWVMIDDETSEIRIGVPYGQATSPSLVLKLNYEELISDSSTPPTFAPPIHFSPYIGREIATGNSYKWSVDDIAANLAIRAERVLPVPPNGWPPSFDLPTTQSQILFASSNADGEVSPIIPGIFDDNGAGIDSYIETACPAIIDGDGKVIKSVFGQNKLGGVQMNIDGLGQGSVYVLALRGKDQKQGAPPMEGQAKATRGAELKLKKPWIAGVPYSCGGSMTNECMRVRVTNDKRPGVCFDIKKIVLYAQPLTTARPG